MNLAIVGAYGKMGSVASEYAKEKGIEVFRIDLKGEIKKIQEVKNALDCVLDFSSEEGLKNTIEFCLERNIPLVSGTTAIDKNIFGEAKKVIPLLHSPNFSLGVNLLFYFLNCFPENLKEFFTPYILEAHHTAKKDKPSGTAKKIGEYINPVEIFSIRAKDEPGTHYLFLYGESETIEIIHRARSRKIFAIGAILACEWILDKPPGLYSMENIWTGKR